MKLTHRIVLFSLALTIVGCGAPNLMLSLRHSGGVSGLEERYTMDQSGAAMRLTRWPQDTAKVIKRGVIGEPLRSEVVGFIQRHRTDLDTIKLSGTGNLTTEITLAYDDKLTRWQWPDLDPPKRSTPVVDSLYLLMQRVQQEIERFPDLNP